MKKAYPLAENKAQLLVCSRACLFSVYTWLALAYVPTLDNEHVYLMASQRVDNSQSERGPKCRLFG